LEAICQMQAKLTWAEAEQRGIRKAIDTYEPYIELLGKEIDSLLGVAVAHGWQSSNAEAGEKCREKIAQLKGIKQEG
jgi:hypothetical protein